MDLKGLHHVTAVSGRIGHNVAFYTGVLGLRLVKKSVNQDDVGAYHLFYADKIGSPGTDMTFFDWPQAGPDRRGADSIAGTAFRVHGRESLEYWLQRLEKHGAPHGEIEAIAGRDVVRFDDPEGQRLMLVDDGGADFEGQVWDRVDVPAAHALRGFHAAVLSVPPGSGVREVLTRVLGFQEGPRSRHPDGGDLTVYETAAGGPGRELWVVEEP